MNSFEPLKGCGSDRIPPIVYQWFGPNAYNWLHKSYKATYQMGLLPKQWLDVKVLFIPKHGKPLCEPRSWRPISLMQYEMKGLEKLLIRENAGNAVRDPSDRTPLGPQRPMNHLNQHGFRKQRSCVQVLPANVAELKRHLSIRHLL